jgi:hypothetical protein
MADITFQDCEALYEKFTEYTHAAEQHEFPVLAMVSMMLDSTKLRNWNISQKEKRSMFRVVLKVMGKDCSDYEEDVNGEQTLAE